MEETLTSALSNKCEIIADMEQKAINLEKFIEQLKQEVKRIEIENEQRIKEVTDKLTTNVLEQQRQLNEQHNSQLYQMSTNFEAKVANLNSLLLKKGEECDELLRKSIIDSQNLKESSKFSTDKALQDQKVLFEEMIEQVRLHNV